MSNQDASLIVSFCTSHIYFYGIFQLKPVTALTWGHNDRRLFVAAGCQVYTLWVTKKVPTLQLSCRHVIQQTLANDSATSGLPLPTKLRNSVAALFSPTIKVRYVI